MTAPKDFGTEPIFTMFIIFIIVKALTFIIQIISTFFLFTALEKWFHVAFRRSFFIWHELNFKWSIWIWEGVNDFLTRLTSPYNIEWTRLIFDRPNHDLISEMKFIFIKEIWATEITPRIIVTAIEYKNDLSRKFMQSRRSSEVPDSNWIGSASYVIVKRSVSSIFSIWNLTHVLCLNASTFE